MSRNCPKKWNYNKDTSIKKMDSATRDAILEAAPPEFHQEIKNQIIEEMDETQKTAYLDRFYKKEDFVSGPN